MLLDGELQRTVISMLRALTDKEHSMQEQMGDISREVEILRKNPK